MLGGNGPPLPPTPDLGIPIAWHGLPVSQRAGLAAFGDNPPGPIEDFDRKPAQITWLKKTIAHGLVRLDRFRPSYGQAATQNGVETMSRIQIQDLPQSAEISAKEMERVFGGNGAPIPPIPTLGVSIAPQRGGLVAIGANPSGPISSVDPVPAPPF